MGNNAKKKIDRLKDELDPLIVSEEGSLSGGFSSGSLEETATAENSNIYPLCGNVNCPCNTNTVAGCGTPP